MMQRLRQGLIGIGIGKQGLRTGRQTFFITEASNQRFFHSPAFGDVAEDTEGKTLTTALTYGEGQFDRELLTVTPNGRQLDRLAYGAVGFTVSEVSFNVLAVSFAIFLGH